MSELALKLIKEAKETRATRLDLGNCGLTELPDELFELTWLEELNLSNWTWEKDDTFTFTASDNKNSFKVISSKISKLKNLQTLCIAGDHNLLEGYSRFRITDISFVASLSNLTNLQLFYSSVSDLLPLKNLKNLRSLSISNTEVKDISCLSELTNLEILAFYETNVHNIEVLDKLINLVVLHFSETEVTDISPIQNLIKLEQVSFSGTKVKNLEAIKNLINLRGISFVNTSISDLTPLKSLKYLDFVEASYTQISDLTPLNEIIKKGLPLLIDSPYWNHDSKGILAMGCTLVNPPKEIIKQGNKAILNYWKQIENSKRLAINNLNDQLKKFFGSQDWKTDYSASERIKRIEELECLFKDFVNSLEEEENYTVTIEFTEDENVIKRLSKYLNIDPKDVRIGEILNLDYKGLKISLISPAVVELYEAKLIIVGEGNTGKTTLFEKLKDNNYQLQPVDETHGINIHEGLEFKHSLIGENVFNANLWDFGGQELQYMTHQFFLTPRGLYVLMMDARKESPNLAYWFKIISLLGRDNQDSTEKVKLLLVFNKRGNTTGTPPQYQDQLKYYEDSLEVQYLEVDFAENDYRFEALQKAIQHSLVTLPIVKSQLPRLWKVVRDDLRDEAKNNQYITTQRYSDMCSKHGITEEADQWLLSGYLHQLGSLLHFQNDKGLMHFVILSPQWATDGVYTFLSAESISANNGRFTDTAFIQLLAAKKYKKAEADLVLQLMTKNNFDICYEATQGNYVAAQLLPENRPPQYIWHKHAGALQFRYQYPIMPKGLMSRLIVRLSEYIEKRDSIEVVWKKGVILAIPTDKNNPESHCRVLMYEDDAESKSGLRQIIIEVMGTPQGHRKHALQRVREEVESLHKKWFRSIKPDEMVPCCCSECVGSDTPELHKLEKLIKLRTKGMNIPVRCYESGEEVSTQNLLEGVYDKGEIREMENHGRY